MDYTARSALEAGFDTVVLIVREEVREELMDHIATSWPSELKVVPVVQGPVAGTAQAVASAAPHVDGPFGVVNADDLYGDEAIALLASQLGGLGGDHLIVSYRLADTILNDAEVTRGVCETTGDGFLTEIVEEKVRQEYNGFFLARPLNGGDWSELTGDEDVSMNLWGLSPGIFEHLEAALAAFDPASAPSVDGKPPEVLLPAVVGDLVRSGSARVRVVTAEGRCIGITHPDDLETVRGILSATSP